MDANAIAILKGLAGVDWIEVAFLIDSQGTMLASVGNSPAFSHKGEFRMGTPPAAPDPDTSVYMTAVSHEIYLGLLFKAAVPIEDVRTLVKSHEASLASAIAPG